MNSIRKTRWLLTAAVGLVWTALPAAAQQGVGNAKEATQDAVEAGRSRRNLRDDRRDLVRIRDIARDWRRAVRRGDKAGEQAADGRLKAWLAEEIWESGRDAVEARQEARASRRERDRSIREAAISGGVKDRHDRRDDRRDLRDDRRDAARAWWDAAETRGVAHELRRIQPSFINGTATRAQYKRKGELLQKLVRLSKREVRQDRREIREDRRERREHRRERREDRRNRRLRHR